MSLISRQTAVPPFWGSDVIGRWIGSPLLLAEVKLYSSDHSFLLLKNEQKMIVKNVERYLREEVECTL